MIKNDHQLQVARTKAGQLDAAAEQSTGTDRSTYEDLAREVRGEIDEYLMIREEVIHAFDVVSLDDLADALVKARINSRVTQADLADALGVKEQMIQRYEAGGYEKASLWRVADVIDALGLHFRGRLTRAEAVSDIHISGPSIAKPTAVVSPFGLWCSTPTSTITIKAGV